VNKYGKQSFYTFGHRSHSGSSFQQGREEDAPSKRYRNCARKPIPSLPGFSRGMNGACVAKHIVA